VKELYGYKVQATDHQAGAVYDLYFDPDTWEVGYLVVDTGNWLPGRKVIVSLETLVQPLWEERILPVTLTQEQLRSSPDIDAGQSLSRFQEQTLRTHYDLPPISRLGGGLFDERTYGMSLDSIAQVVETEIAEMEDARRQEDHPSLQSSRRVMGYPLQAQDGEVGHVEDFIVDDRAWVLRYMVVDTGNWLPGRKVLISTQWLDTVTWGDAGKVHVGLSRESIKNSPEYDPVLPVGREYESTLHNYYDRTEYWR
jgi:uncharacterized protein YrrD